MFASTASSTAWTPEGETFEQYTRRFLAELDREIRDQKAVGLKSCAAYSEGGLDVRPVEGGEAGQAYDRLRAGSAGRGMSASCAAGC